MRAMDSQSMGIPDAVLEAGYVQGKVDYTKPEQVAKAAMQVKLSRRDVGLAARKWLNHRTHSTPCGTLAS